MMQEHPEVPATFIAVTPAKMAAGAVVAGALGALDGLIAGIAEAELIAGAFDVEIEPPNIDPTDKKPPKG